MTQAVRRSSLRRSTLLGRTALGASLLVFGGMAATEAGAQVSSGSGATVNAGNITGQFTAGGAGGATFTGHVLPNTAAAEISNVTLGSDRTLLTWGGFNLESNDTLNFVFGARGDIVLNRVDAGNATIDGFLNGTIGTVGGAVGGNIWFTSAGGVTFGSGAVVNTGGLLATTGAITGADFFDGNANFTFSAAPASSTVGVLNGAQLNLNGGTLALIAPAVSTAAGSTIGDTAGDSDVLFGAAEGFTITFAPDTNGDLDLLSWIVPAGALADVATPIAIAGTTTAGNVYIAAVSKRAAGAVISIGGLVTANGAAVDGKGNIVLSAGGNLTGGTAAAGGVITGPVASANAEAGVQAVDLTIGAALDADGSVRALANGAVTVNSNILAGVGDISLTGATLALTGVTIDTNDGNIAFTGATTVSGANTIDAGSSGPARSTTFNNDVNGGGSLALGGAAVTFNGSVGATTALASVAATSAVTLAGGGVTTTGNQSYGGALTLGADTTLSGATPSFASVIGGNFDLTLLFSNPTTITGAFTGINDLRSGGGGTTNLTGTITTTGNQTYNDAVTLTGDTTLNGVTPVFALTVAGGGNDLALNFTNQTVITSDFTGIDNLSTGAGGSTLLGGFISTTGNQSYGDAVTLGANTVLQGATPSFSAGVIGDGNDLTLNFTGTTAITGAFTGIANLASGGTGTTTLTGSITTTGNQSYSDAVTLAGDTTLTGLTPSFASVTGDGLKDLTLLFSGPTTITGAFTGINDLRSGGGGATNLTGTISTTGNQTYNDAVTLTGDTILNGVTPVFALTVAGGGNDLVLNFTNQTVITSDFTGIDNLTTGAGGSTLLGGFISTTGNQSYGDAVTLGANTVLQGGALIDFDQTISGPFGLEVRTAGDTNIEGAVNIASLTTDAGGFTQIVTSTITTSGAQTYGDAVLLFTDVTLTGGSGSFTSIAGSGGDRGLALNFGGVTTLGGNLSNIRNLSVAGGGTTNLSGSVNTSGTQTFTDAVTLTSDATLTSTGAGANGNITLNGLTGGGLDLTVTSTAGSTLTFNAGGASGIDALQASAGNIDVNAALSAATVNLGALDGSIDLGADVTATGNAVLQATAASGTIVGNGRVTGIQVLLNAGAGIGVSPSDRVGTAADTLTASGGTGGVFLSELNGVTLQSSFGPINNAGASYDLTAGGAIGVAGAVTAPNGVTLTAMGGDVAFSPAGQITAASGNITLTASDNLIGNGGGPLTAQNIVLTADNFIFGILSAATLQETNNVSIIDTAGGLTITSGDGLSATNGLSIQTTNGGALDVGGVSAPGFITLTSAAGLTLTDAINGGGGLVTLTAGGPTSAAAGVINQTGGIITAGLLGGSAGAGSSATLTGANAVTSLGNFTANGFSFTNSGALSVIGAVNGGASATIAAGGDLTLTAPASISTTNGPINLTALGGTSDLVLDGAVNAGTGTVTTNAGASISQDAGSVITAGQLTGAAGTSAQFIGSGNQVATLGNFTTGTAAAGNFMLFDGRSLSTVAGTTVDTNGSSIQLRTLGAGSHLTLNGTLDASGGGAVILETFGAGSDITQAGGALLGAALTGISTGTTTLTVAGPGGNNVANLGFFQAGNGFSFAQDGGFDVVNTVNGVAGVVNLTSGNGDILVAAPNGFVTSASTVDIDAGGALTINGRVNGGTGVELTSVGALTIGAGTFRVQTTSGTLRMANSGGADIAVNGGVDAGAGAIDIDSTNGSVLIGATGSLNGAGLIDVDAGALITVGGAVNSATAVDLQSAGLLSVTGLGQVGSSGSIRLASTGGAVAIGGLGAAALGVFDLDSATGVTQTTAISGGTLTGTNLGTVTLLNASNDFGALGAFQAPELHLRDAGNLNVTGAVNIGAGLFELVSAGSIDQASGSVITAGTFTGSANGAVDLFDGVNQVANLGAFTNTGTSFALRNGAALTLTGLLTNTGGAASLTTTVGGITLNNAINAGGNTLSLVSAGGITQNASGVITAATLIGSATGAVDLDDVASNIATLGAFSAGAGFFYRDADGFTVDGPVSSGSSALSLSSNAGNIVLDGDLDASGQTVNLTTGGGGVTQTGGVITAQTLTAGTISTLADLQQDNEIDNLGAFSANGLLLRDLDGLTVTGAVSLGALGGDIVTVDGDLTVAVGASITVTTGPGALRLETESTGDMIFNGPVSNAGRTLELVSAGEISQSNAGILTAGLLTGSSVDETDLLTAANAIARLGDFEADGFSLRNGVGLRVVGRVDGRGFPIVIVTNSGDLEIRDDATDDGEVLTLGGSITLETTAGDIALNGAVGGGGVGPTFGPAATVDLISAGAIAQNATGLIAANSLTASAVNGVTLNQGNTINVFASLTNTTAGQIDVRSAATGAAGFVNVGTVSNTGGGVIIDSDNAGLRLTNNISALAPNAVLLFANGKIQQDTGVITAANLNAFAAGGIELDNDNVIPFLGSLTNTGGGDIFVRDVASTVTTNTISGGVNTTIRADRTGGGDLVVGANFTSANNLTLFATGALTSASGRVVTATAGDATLTADTVNFGTANAGNDVFVVGPNGITLTGANAGNRVDIRAVAGNVTATNLSSGEDTLLRAGGNLNVVNRANVGRDYDIEFNTFTGLASGSNTLNPLFSPGRDFLIRSTNASNFNFIGETLSAPRDVTVVSVSGINAGGVSAGRDGRLTAQAGGISLNANIAAGDDVFLTASNAINQPGGIISAPKLTASSSGGMSLNRANQVANIVALTNTGGGGVLVNDAASSVTVGTVIGGSSFVEINATNGSMTLTTPMSANGNLTLTALNGLSGSSATSVGGQALVRGSSVTLTGALTAATDARATATSGGVSLGSAAAGQDAVLAAAGGITVTTTVAAARDANLNSGTGTSFATLTAGRDANLTAGGALNFTSATAGNDLNAKAASLNGQTARSSRDANLETTGAISLTTLDVDRNANVTSGGATSVTTLTADNDAKLTVGGALNYTTATTGGDLTAAAASIAGQTSNVGRNAALTSTGATTLGALTTGQSANLQAGGALGFTTATTGTDLIASAAVINGQTSTVGRDAILTSTGATTLGALATTRDARLTAGGELGFTTATAGRDLTAQAASITGQTATIDRNASLTATAAGVQVGSLTVGKDLAVTAATLAQVNRLTSTGANADLTLRGQDVVVGAAAGETPPATSQLTLNASNPGALNLIAARDATVNVSGGARVASLEAGRTGSVTTLGGDALVITATAGDTLAVTANGGSARLRNATLGASARSLDVRATGAGGDAVLGADTGTTAGAGERLAVPAGLAVRVQGDRDATVNLQNGFAVTSLVAGRAASATSTQGDVRIIDARAGTTLAVSASQGQVDLTTVTTTGAAGAAGSDITAVGRGVTIATANAAGTLDVRATAGNAAVDTATAGADLRVAASQDASLRSATLTATVAGNRELRVTGGRAASLGRAPGGTAAGALSLADPGRTAVIVTAGTGNATIDVPSDVLLTQVTSASGDVSLLSPGAITVRSSGGVNGALSGRDVTVTSTGSNVALANLTASRNAAITAAQGSATLDNSTAGGNLTAQARTVTASGGTRVTGDTVLRATAGGVSTSDVVTGRDITLAATGGGITVDGSATAGRALSIDTDATATLATASNASIRGATVLVRANDLALNGALVGTTSATIESRSGGVVLGDGVTGAGMAITNAEFGRITTPALEIAAGSQAAGATARGDIVVGDLDVNGAALDGTTLLAGAGHTVTISGQLTPTGGPSNLTIGKASAASGWTPDEIIVTGGIGEATTQTGVTFTGINAFGAVELNAGESVIFGTPAFVAAVRDVPVSQIDIARGLPAGVRAQGADVNRMFLVAGTLTLRADGRVVQQSTGQVADRTVGILLDNPGPNRAANVLSFGRTGGPGAAGTLIPELIDLSMSLTNAGGTLLTGQVVAASPNITLGDLTPNNAYRINGCSIGAAGNCTPLSNQLVDPRIDALVVENLLQAEEPPLLNDPTITGAGNEEIWRLPDVQQEEEEEEEEE